MKEDYLGVLIVWLYLFAILSIFLSPAVLYRNLARKHNKQGWVYFAIGIGVGSIGLELGKLAANALKPLVEQKENVSYLSIVIFLIAYSIIAIGFLLLKRSIVRKY
jgi:hypothetical protein